VSRSDRILAAAGGAAVVLAGVAVFILLAPAVAPVPSAPADPNVGLVVGTPSAVAPATSDQPPASNGTIFVDVEGAVAMPGIRELPAGSRVADAIAAAGGYASDADLEAAAATINLAQPLGDGEQVQVPRIGDTRSGPASPAPAVAGGGSGGGSGGSTSTGLVDLNTATPEELEALPGIGPVTVQKIVAARQESPFASLQDAVDRGVIHRGQLEDIQEVATAG
jgi:competence protein ComEA